ncbi:MAG: phosphopantetheine-binding protein, partial [Pyrinomonadaceae bacterium]
YRIELGEVEAALREHEWVKEAAVVVEGVSKGSESERRGGEGSERDGAAREGGRSEGSESERGDGGEGRLVGYVVWGEGRSAATVEELRGWMRERVPEYMVPARYVAVKEMPLTPNGKLDRRALSAMTDVKLVEGGDYVAPRNYVEMKLAKMWGDLLQAGQVGREDDFFKLGGHSLLATQMLSRVRTTFQIELTMSELFRSPTLSGLSSEIIWRQAEQVDREALARLVAEIKQLTVEEVGALLATEARAVEESV